LNDYTIGALEGLAYAKAILDKHFSEKDEGPVLDAYAELEEAQLKMLKHAVQSFSNKLARSPTNTLG
jgi:sialic acid synthase SpsE